MDLQPIFSVSEFNEAINRHLGLLGEVVVAGEISQLKVSQGKWIYITIKDSNSSVEVFGMTFKITNLHSLEEGMQVKVSGNPSLYQKTGRFSLQANKIIPSGEGALRAAYEKLKKLLDSEGLFAVDRKRKLPIFPQSIGLLTAKDSEAYRDFIKVTNGRIGGVKIFFYPAIVQGNSAVSSVIGGIKYFNAKKTVDVLVITRGGGSLEDLIAFNDEQMVREVFASIIPTVCAIGHEGDVSLVELAADLRGSTPSNASELLFRSRSEVLREIHQNIYFIMERISTKIDKIEESTKRTLNRIERYLDNSFSQITQSIMRFYNQIDRLSHKIEFLNQSLFQTESRMKQSILAWIKLKLEQLNNLEDKLRTLDPASIMKRGFSITRDKSGKIIRSVNQVVLKSFITTVLSDGTIGAIVTNKSKEEYGR